MGRMCRETWTITSGKLSSLEEREGRRLPRLIYPEDGACDDFGRY